MQRLGQHLLLLALRQIAQDIVTMRQLLLVEVLVRILSHDLQVSIEQILLVGARLVDAVVLVSQF